MDNLEQQLKSNGFAYNETVKAWLKHIYDDRIDIDWRVWVRVGIGYIDLSVDTNEIKRLGHIIAGKRINNPMMADIDNAIPELKSKALSNGLNKAR